MSEPAPEVDHRSREVEKPWRPYDPYIRHPQPVTAAEFGAALLRVNESMTSALAEYESGGAR